MPLPRTLTLIALLWSVASLLTTVGARVPIQPTTLSYTPGIRAMVVMLAVGACAIYPVARGMTARGAWSPGRAALDGVAMSVMFTVLYWPLQLVTHWPRSTGLAVWVAVLGWVWVAVGCVALALDTRSPWVRAAWVIACPALLGAGALLDALGAPHPVPALLGPAVAVLELAPRGSSSTVPDASALASFPLMLAALVWGVRCAAHARAFAPAPMPR